MTVALWIKAQHGMGSTNMPVVIVVLLVTLFSHLKMFWLSTSSSCCGKIPWQEQLGRKGSLWFIVQYSPSWWGHHRSRAWSSCQQREHLLVPSSLSAFYPYLVTQAWRVVLSPSTVGFPSPINLINAIFQEHPEVTSLTSVPGGLSPSWF